MTTMDIDKTIKALETAGVTVGNIKTHPLCIQRRILADRCKDNGVTPVTRFAITTRVARQTLFNINSAAADELRRELFNIADQDSDLPEEFIVRYATILAKYAAITA